MKEADAKRIVADSGRMLLDEGLTARTWGNISCRTGKDTMVITPSGLGYESMTADDIATMDMNTGKWTGKLKPSSEKGVHIAAYRAFSDAQFVIHTHQAYASAIGIVGFEALSLSAEEKDSLGGVALAGYGLPGTKKLAKNVAAAFATGSHVVLMAHHGAVIAGKDRAEAFERALLLEDVCRRACEGQPAVSPGVDDALATKLTAAAKKAYGFAAFTGSPAVLACAASGETVLAQLDDMAQMIGKKLITAGFDENSVVEALKKHDLVLVPGVGAICRAASDGDCHAMCLLAEKSCICWLHTKALGVKGKLSGLDTWLMRTIYLKKYSKKIGG